MVDGVNVNSMTMKKRVLLNRWHVVSRFHEGFNSRRMKQSEYKVNVSSTESNNCCIYINVFNVEQ